MLFSLDNPRPTRPNFHIHDSNDPGWQHNFSSLPFLFAKKQQYNETEFYNNGGVYKDVLVYHFFSRRLAKKAIFALPDSLEPVTQWNTKGTDVLITQGDRRSSKG